MSDQVPGGVRLGVGDGRADPGGTGAGVERFVLDLDSNPHPVMLRHALAHRRQAHSEQYQGEPGASAFWLGYLAAMADATGCTENELLLWLDSHEGEVR